MNARQIYAALFDPRGPVLEPSGEWSFVGDTGCYEPARMKTVLASAIGGPRAYVAVSRHDAVEIAVDSVPELVREYLELGTVRVADIALKRFLEVHPAGVARSWGHDA